MPLHDQGDDEPRLTLKQAARLKQLCKDGHPIHIATLHRWRLRGVRGVRLRTWLVGGVRVTTESAVIEFLERLNNPGLPPDAPTPSDRVRQIIAAERELELAGFGAFHKAKTHTAHAARQGAAS
jgi:hypothetical protein